MLGVAVMLLVAPFYLGAALLGAAIGIGLRIEQGRRRQVRAQAARRPRKRCPRPTGPASADRGPPAPQALTAAHLLGRGHVLSVVSSAGPTDPVT
jgi:hypothetical protein